jgi:hypothetical protein
LRQIAAAAVQLPEARQVRRAGQGFDPAGVDAVGGALDPRLRVGGILGELTPLGGTRDGFADPLGELPAAEGLAAPAHRQAVAVRADVEGGHFSQPLGAGQQAQPGVVAQRGAAQHEGRQRREVARAEQGAEVVGADVLVAEVQPAQPGQVRRPRQVRGQRIDPQQADVADGGPAEEGTRLAEERVLPASVHESF